MSDCTKKIKTDECIKTRDDGYDECNAWADEGSSQCTAWKKCKWYTPWNCIAGFFCKAWYWVANIVCKGYHWVSNVVCIAWKYVASAICVLVDVVSTLVNIIVAAVEIVLSIIGGVIGFVVAILLSIPYVGRAVDWVLNVIKAVAYGLASLPDVIIGLLGIMPEKRMKLLVVIQKDEFGKPVVHDLEVVRRAVQYLINVFRSELNVRVMPVNLVNFKTAFSSDDYSLDDFLKVDDGTSDHKSLDVCCDSCAAGDDLSSAGAVFNLMMARLGFVTSGRRLIGYGAPIIAFAVRSYTDGKAGCSLGPLSDYVTVKFNERNSGNKGGGGGRYAMHELTSEKPLDAVTDLAHEIAHACNLPHCCDFPEMCCGADDNERNLMKEAPERRGGLRKAQKLLLRSSRHVTYF